MEREYWAEETGSKKTFEKNDKIPCDDSRIGCAQGIFWLDVMASVILHLCI